MANRVGYSLNDLYGFRYFRNGFTIVEMMVALSISCILIAFAAPVIKRPSTTTEANALLGTLRYARSIAVKQGATTIVCPSTNPTAGTPTCATTSFNWSTGWIVLVPAVSSCTAPGGNAGDQVLQIQQPFNSTDTATSRDSTTFGTVANSFCFFSSGFSPSANTGVVQFDFSPVKIGQRRCVIVSGVGHMQLVDAGRQDASGTVTCPTTVSL